MYRQPANCNRVKSMKTKFENMNPPLMETTQITQDTEKFEPNNNSINPQLTQNELNLPAAPNLIRQLNDAGKKGCIKRTPAFRKEKLQSRGKTPDVLTFTNIFQKFEHENSASPKQKLTSTISLTNTQMSATSKPKLTTSYSLTHQVPPNDNINSSIPMLNTELIAKFEETSSTAHKYSEIPTKINQKSSSNANESLSTSSTTLKQAQLNETPRKPSFLYSKNVVPVQKTVSSQKQSETTPEISIKSKLIALEQQQTNIYQSRSSPSPKLSPKLSPNSKHTQYSRNSSPNRFSSPKLQQNSPESQSTRILSPKLSPKSSVPSPKRLLSPELARNRFLNPEPPPDLNSTRNSTPNRFTSPKLPVNTSKQVPNEFVVPKLSPELSLHPKLSGSYSSNSRESSKLLPNRFLEPELSPNSSPSENRRDLLRKESPRQFFNDKLSPELPSNLKHTENQLSNSKLKDFNKDLSIKQSKQPFSPGKLSPKLSPSCKLLENQSPESRLNDNCQDLPRKLSPNSRLNEHSENVSLKQSKIQLLMEKLSPELSPNSKKYENQPSKSRLIEDIDVTSTKESSKRSLTAKQSSNLPVAPVPTPNSSPKTENYPKLATDSTLRLTDRTLVIEKSISVKELIKNMSEPVKPPEYAQVIKSKKESVDNKQIGLTDTLKAALKQPLPAGPPPKKPPRTFAHTPKEPKPVVGKIKSDPKLMLEKLENALLNNKIRSPKLPRKFKMTGAGPSGGVCEPNLYTVDSPSPAKTIFPNCLPSLNCASSSAYGKAIAKNTSTFFTHGNTDKGEEPIYAEPFQHELADQSDTLSTSLHYMSNPVCNQVWDSEDVERHKSEKLTRQKLNLIMNHTYASPNHSDSDIDSLTSTPSGDESSKHNTIRDLIKTFEESHQIEQNGLTLPEDIKSRLTQPDDETSGQNEGGQQKKTTGLHRTMTEIRKKYVRKMCSTLKRKSEVPDTKLVLFECCLLVGLNVSTLTPYIKSKFPNDYEVPPWVEHLCFPDAGDWSEKSTPKPSQNTQQDCQCYSLVITNERGDRKFGYCRRVVPEEASVCLPLTYCIISSYRAAGFYHKVLQELESRHGLPFWLQNAFVCEIHACRFPQPGESIQITCLFRRLVINSCADVIDQTTTDDLDKENNEFKTPKNTYGTINIRNHLKSAPDAASKRNGQIFDDFENPSDDDKLNRLNLDFSREQLLNLPNSQLIHDCLLGDVVIKRPFDSRLENVDLTVLFNTLNLTCLLQTFGTLLHERKVILISSCLSKLSSCVEALQSILYPFNWQHTFIPVLSSNMLDIVSAPLPLIAGVLASHITETLPVEEGIAVDLDTSTLIYTMGDESDIIPKRLKTGLTIALQLVTEATTPEDSCRNVLVSDAFVRMFVEACGTYKQFITGDERDSKQFERDQFIKHHSSKSVNLFLDWFSETAMFQAFIQSQLEGDTSDLFEVKCLEMSSARNSSAMLKNSKVTQKMKHFGQKLFHS